MSKPQQTPVTTRATATRTYTWGASEAHIINPSWAKVPSAITDVHITIDQDGRISAKWYGVALKQDGTPGKAERSGQWYGTRDMPHWLLDLTNDMPRPKVTLVPPRKDVTP